MSNSWDPWLNAKATEAIEREQRALKHLDGNKERTSMTEPQHGDPVESWTIHTHEVRLICPKCRYMMHQAHRPSYTFDYPHIVRCQCGQAFRVRWADKTQNAKVTIHTYVDIDTPEIDEDEEEDCETEGTITAKIVNIGEAEPEI